MHSALNRRFAPTALAFAMFWLLALLLAACSSPPPVPTLSQEDFVSTIVAATLTAQPSPALPPTSAAGTATPSPALTDTALPTETPSPTATASPTPMVDNVAGKICYPAGEIPAMTAYFENTGDEAVTTVEIDAGQDEYKVTLAPGSYIAYVWLPDFSRGGLYSRAVPCGLSSSCTDHGLLPFTVTAEESLKNIDLCDWYAGPFGVPYPPGIDQDNLTGGIAGSITLPEKIEPPVRVVAFNTQTHYWYWVGVIAGQSTFSLPDLPAGVYRVVAYDAAGRAGGYTTSGHTLLDVLVKAGETNSAVTIQDWDAPAGTFPEDPTR